MLRVLLFFAIVLAAGLGFAWLADHPGTVAISWLGRDIQLSFLTFLVVAVLLVLAILLVVTLLGGLFRAPGRIGGFFAQRRRREGHRALSAGILAAGAGDAATARRLVQRGERYLDPRREPLLRFLDAQTAMIEGDHARARRVFEAMEREPATRLLALRGLFLEAERTGDPVAARHYAEQAVRIAPHINWAGGAVLELKAAEGDFDSALEILKAQRKSHLLGRTESDRLRAVLLTGKAQQVAASDPDAARVLAREAQNLAPDLVPAATTAARAMIAAGDTRRASKLLEKSWTRAPHPEIAELYVHAKPGEGAADRLLRAERLKAIHPNDPESAVAMAHAAFDAHDYRRARAEIEAAIRMAPRESMFLLLAEIEEREGAEPGRVRAAMAKALAAPRDPAWVSDGAAAGSWSAVSPATGRLDSFEWKALNDRAPVLRTLGAEREGSSVGPGGSSGEAGALVETGGDRRPEGADVSMSPASAEVPSREAIDAETVDAQRRDARFNI